VSDRLVFAAGLMPLAWNDDDAMTPWGLIRADETDDYVAAALAGHAFLPTKAERDAGLPGPRGPAKC
jgi:hypothetical protein